MKRFAVLVVLAMAISAAAQTEIAESKPSAAMPRENQSTLSQSQTSTQWALPVGTAIKFKLETPLSTAANQRGDRFGGRVTEAVKLNGRVVIPVGAALEGDVVRADEHRRIRGTGTLDLLPRLITLPDGRQLRVNAMIVDTSNHKDINITDEGQIKPRGHDRNDMVETALGTGAGAGVGAAIGGGKGALIGATVGAGATLVHWLTKTKTAYLPAGTEIIIELNRPLQLNYTDGD